MQDEVNEKTIALYIKTGKLTAQTLQKAMKAILSKGKKQLAKTESSYSYSDNSKSEKSSHKESTSNTEDTTVVEETTKKPESSSTKKVQSSM